MSTSQERRPTPPIPADGGVVDPRAWWVLLSVGIGTFMSALDGSVVNTVLPLLRTELHTTVATIEWVTTVYLLVVSGLLLGVGRAGDLIGQKRLYLAGFAIVIGGSAMCGLAPSAGALVALRAVQAVGASMLFASSPAILTKAFPARFRGRALGMQGDDDVPGADDRSVVRWMAWRRRSAGARCSTSTCRWAPWRSRSRCA